LNRMEQDQNYLKTGTTTVAVVCRDGIVMGADKRATAGNLIVSKDVRKIFDLTLDMAVTVAGTVSDVQLLVKVTKAEIRLRELRTDRKPTVKEVANLLGGLVYGNIRRFSVIPGVSHFILGGKDIHGFHLYDLFADGSITEIKDYITSGSGSVMAYGVLESQYKKGMSIDEGTKLIVDAISASMQRDSASGNGVDVISITAAGLKSVYEKELNTKLSY